MKIAIIGASGYIGSNLIKRLLIDNSRDKIVAVSTHATGIALEDDRLEKVDCDILTSTDIQKILQGVMSFII